MPEQAIISPVFVRNILYASVLFAVSYILFGYYASLYGYEYRWFFALASLIVSALGLYKVSAAVRNAPTGFPQLPRRLSVYAIAAAAIGAALAAASAVYQPLALVSAVVLIAAVILAIIVAPAALIYSLMKHYRRGMLKAAFASYIPSIALSMLVPIIAVVPWILVIASMRRISLGK